MRPGQSTVNELEAVVLQRLSSVAEALFDFIPTLHVLSREYTGVGCYTHFAPLATPVSYLGDRQIGLPGIIVLPGVPSGLQVYLACTNGSPDFLEFVTFATERWDGTFEGFSIKLNA